MSDKSRSHGAGKGNPRVGRAAALRRSELVRYLGALREAGYGSFTIRVCPRTGRHEIAVVSGGDGSTANPCDRLLAR